MACRIDKNLLCALGLRKPGVKSTRSALHKTVTKFNYKTKLYIVGVWTKKLKTVYGLLIAFN